MSIFGAVKERTYALIETGEYVFTLNDLSEDTGQYGDALKWEWLIAPVSDPTNYLCNHNGMEKTLRVWTDADITIGSQTHEWVQALTGHTLKAGDPPPDENELLGRRMVAYLTHQAPKKGPNAGKLREKIVPGSAKVFRGPQPNKTVYVPQAAAPAPVTESGERAVLLKRLNKLIGNAVMLETENAGEYVALDLTDQPDEYLEALISTVDAEVKRAVAAG